MNILLPGFIGQHLLRALETENHQINVYSRNPKQLTLQFPNTTRLKLDSARILDVDSGDIRSIMITNRHVVLADWLFTTPTIIIQLIPIPYVLFLGHATSIESPVDDEKFALEFKINHPLFGQIYEYVGVFNCQQV